MLEISVIVITYNTEWEKLQKTVDSILIQKNVNYEIIFADDGSEKQWDSKIKDYIPNDCKFIIANSNKNVGTVSNICNAIEFAQGKYIKVISPGDYFFNEYSLQTWLDYLKKSNAKVSFCNAVYYKNPNIKIKTLASPCNSNLYDGNHRKSLFIDYLIANDTILGATLLGEKTVLKKYLFEINGRIKYAEDYMIRLMIFDDIDICYVNYNLMFYESGEGVSTSGNAKWAALLQKDFNASNDILKKRKNCVDLMQIKYQNYLNRLKENSSAHNKILKLLIFPSVIFYRIKMKFFPKKTNY